jgi:amino acid adenylation domain-containing protein
MASENILAAVLRRVTERPDGVALHDKWRAWTWGELSARAMCYAAAIAETVSVRDHTGPVPIITGRSGEVLAAMLGAMMTGRGSAMLSPEQPIPRLRDCLADLDCGDFMIDARTEQEREEAPLELPTLEIPDEAPNVTPLSSFPGDGIAYIIFTSGSTGRPKGVMVSHDNILNTLQWSWEHVRWIEADVIGSATKFSFDIAMFDVFTFFYYGVPLSIFPVMTDVNAILNQMAATNVTFLFSVPAFFTQFSRFDALDRVERSSLRRIISGGDFFPPAHILRWLDEAPSVEVINCWGPTETSVVNTFHVVGEEDRPALVAGGYPPVGRASPCQRFVLIDDDGAEVVEPGAHGEIVMLGDCVSQGYLKDPERTQVAFAPHRGERAYRTGDLAYLNAANDLFIAGRKGAMVKIAGHRVDLNDVESAAASLDNVHLAGAFVREIEPGVHELCVALEIIGSVDEFDLFSAKKTFRSLLPQYMVPKRLYPMAELPLSENRKVNRPAIAAMFPH